MACAVCQQISMWDMLLLHTQNPGASSLLLQHDTVCSEGVLSAPYPEENALMHLSRLHCTIASTFGLEHSPFQQS